MIVLETEGEYIDFPHEERGTITGRLRQVISDVEITGKMSSAKLKVDYFILEKIMTHDPITNKDIEEERQVFIKNKEYNEPLEHWNKSLSYIEKPALGNDIKEYLKELYSRISISRASYKVFGRTDWVVKSIS